MDNCCNLNDDCFRGRNHDGPCRFPTWQDDDRATGRARCMIYANERG